MAKECDSDFSAVKLLDFFRSWSVQEITQSRIYPAYIIDVFLNMSILFLTLMCNLYLAFVAGTSVQDVLSKLVILNFILDQQAKFKTEIFKGTTGRIVLQALRAAYELGAPPAVASPKDRKFIELYGKEVAIRKRLLRAFPLAENRAHETAEDGGQLAPVDKAAQKLATENYENAVKEEMEVQFKKLAGQEMKKDGWLIKRAERNIERIEAWEAAVEGKAQDELMAARKLTGLTQADRKAKIKDYARQMCDDYINRETQNKRYVDAYEKDPSLPKPTNAEVFRKNAFETVLHYADKATSEEMDYMDYVTRLHVSMIRTRAQKPAQQYARKKAFEEHRDKLIQGYRDGLTAARGRLASYTGKIFKFKVDRLSVNGRLRSAAETSLLFLGIFPVYVAAAFVIYAPICKPGPTYVVDIVNHK